MLCQYKPCQDRYNKTLLTFSSAWCIIYVGYTCIALIHLFRENNALEEYMDKLYHIDVMKRNITDALLELMRKKDFHSITITEIVAEARVGRATFYRNFASKEDVLKYYFDLVIKRFKIPTKFVPHTDEGYYETVVYILKAVGKNKRLIRRVLDANLALTVLDYLDEQYTRLFESSGKAISELVPYLYSGAVFNLTRKWISDDCTVPAEEVADAIFYASFGRNYRDVAKNEKPDNTANSSENVNKD